MDGIVLLALVLAAAYAIDKSRAYAWRRAKTAARTKLQSYRTRHTTGSRPPARPGRTGKSVGWVAGAAAAGLVEGARGFGVGARVGWRQGWTKAYAWRGRRATAPAAETPHNMTPATGTGVASPLRRPALAAVADDPVAVPAGARRARLHLVGAQEPTPTDAPAVTEPPVGGGGVPSTPTSLEGQNAMAIDTVTGGEVQTMDQLLAELEAIGQEATAELEDAQGDAARAKEDAQRVETMVASLAQLNLDQDSLAEIGALAEDSASRLSAAEQRATAAESRAAHAQQAIEGVRSRHQLMQEAHDATPHPADREFYQR